jgi:hypothetical protein
MSLGANLPVIVPGMIVLIVISVAAALGLAWTKDAGAQVLIRRVWMALSAMVVVGVVVFYVSSGMVATRAPTVDRSVQQQQQSDLQQRIQNGGH